MLTEEYSSGFTIDLTEYEIRISIYLNRIVNALHINN